MFSSLALSERGNVAYIFTFPSLSVERNCSGKIVAAQFCFTTNHDTFIMVIFFLNRHNDNEFLVQNIYHVQVQTGTICSSPNIFPGNDSEVQVCCGTHAFAAAEMLHISSTEFAFGVTKLSDPLLTFSTSNIEYQVQQHQLCIAGRIGDTITVSESNITTQALPLLRFLIGTH